MKGSLLLLLLGTLCLCLAFHAAAEDPTPETPAAAPAVNAGPAAVMGPVAFDDVYTISAAPGQRISQALSVLANDLPPGATLEVLGSSTNTNNYGRIIVRNTDLLYEVDSYDGWVHNDVFGYTMFIKPNSGTTATANVNVTVRPGVPNDFIARADAFEFEWNTANNYHWEILDVLGNDSGTGLRLTKVFKGIEMVGELRMTTSNIYYMVEQYTGGTINDVFHYNVMDAKGRVRKAKVVVRVKESMARILVAQPDSFFFTLDKRGNLAPQVLDVLKNDLGTGIQMIDYTFGDNMMKGTLRWSPAKNKFVYLVRGHKGGGFTTSFDYTIRDTAGLEESTTATIAVAATSPPDIPITLKNDVLTRPVPQGETVTWSVYVLANDKPSENLELRTVERVGPGFGSMSRDSTHTFFYYTVNTDGMLEGQRFTDVFRYTAGPWRNTDFFSTATVTMNMIVDKKLK